MPPLPTATRRCLFLSPLRRRFSSAVEYPLSHPIYTIWGANTAVGKTLVSAGIAASFLSPASSPSFKFNYIKPVQTGFPSDSDSQFVYRKFSEIFIHRRSKCTVFASNCTLKVSIPAAECVLGSGYGVETENSRKCETGFWELGCYEGRKLKAEGGEEAGRMGQVSHLICKTMYGWREAVSPHLAAQRENAVVADSVLLEMLQRCLPIGLEEGKSDVGDDVSGYFSLIETAGGVASPGPSGSLQCDLYRC